MLKGLAEALTDYAPEKLTKTSLGFRFAGCPFLYELHLAAPYSSGAFVLQPSISIFWETFHQIFDRMTRSSGGDTTIVSRRYCLGRLLQDREGVPDGGIRRAVTAHDVNMACDDYSAAFRKYGMAFVRRTNSIGNLLAYVSEDCDGRAPAWRGMLEFVLLMEMYGASFACESVPGIRRDGSPYEDRVMGWVVSEYCYNSPLGNARK